jgi:hypothetical protein
MTTSGAGRHAAGPGRLADRQATTSYQKFIGTKKRRQERRKKMKRKKIFPAL